MTMMRPIALSVLLACATVSAYATPNPTPAEETIVTLDTVVVTVQKRPEQAKDVPQSMTVVSASTRDNARIQSAYELDRVTPNMSSTQAGGINTVSLRGIGGGGRNIGFDPRVGVYLDGVYIGQAGSLVMPMWGLDQAVVLRGPQGALFGRNSVAGAIVLESSTPPDTFQGSASATLGADRLMQGRVHVGGPLTDRQRLQAHVAHEERDGVLVNQATGQSVDNRNRQLARVRWDMDISETDVVRVSADRARVRERNIVGAPATGFFGTPLPADQVGVVDMNVTPRSDVDVYGGSATWEHVGPRDRTWTVIAGHRALDHGRMNDIDYSAADLLWGDYDDSFRTNSLEARVATSGNARHRAVVGLYAAQERASSNRTVTIGTDVATRIPVPGVPVLVPFGAAFGLSPGLGARAQGHVDTDQYALFAMWDWDATDRVTTHVGGRFTHERKDVRYNLDGSGSGRMQIATLTGFTDDRSRSTFSPTAGVSMKINEDATAYATYATGTKSGGWNLDFLNVGQAAGDFSFDDETVQSVELGVRGHHGRFSYDASAFVAEIDDHQVFQFVALGGGGSVLQLRNAARAKSEGLELQAAYQATDRLKIDGGLGLQHARFVDFPNGGTAGANLSGNDLPDAPHQTANIGVSWGWDALGGAWEASARARHRSEAFSGADNTANQRLDEQNVLSARLTFQPQAGGWSASVWAENLTDEDAVVYRTRDFFGHEVEKRMEPRAVGVDITVEF